MNRLSNSIMSIALMLGSQAIAGGSQSEKTAWKINSSTFTIIENNSHARTCWQPSSEGFISVGCEDIRSILKENPWFTADAKDKLPNWQTRHVVRNKDGHIILYVISASDKK